MSVSSILRAELVAEAGRGVCLKRPECSVGGRSRPRCLFQLFQWVAGVGCVNCLKTVEGSVGSKDWSQITQVQYQ